MSKLGTARGILTRAVYDLLDAPRSTDSQYGIMPGYRHRRRTHYFDDTPRMDEWQREVYVAAAELMKKERLRTVYDVGCGSGYKLMRYLGDYDTTGFDIEPTLSFLRKTYTDRKWRSVTFEDRDVASADLVVCADVIEHVDDPDALLAFLSRVAGRYLVLSTPDRDLVYPENGRRR